jgi:hypothetical protein
MIGDNITNLKKKGSLYYIVVTVYSCSLIRLAIELCFIIIEQID